MEEKAALFGLKVNKEKCIKIDKDSDEKILFAGVPLSTKERVERVEEITNKYKDELASLKELKIPLHQKLILF